VPARGHRRVLLPFSARALIQQTGYHRRDAELAEVGRQLEGTQE
jgi:hypothetical protein